MRGLVNEPLHNGTFVSQFMFAKAHCDKPLLAPTQIRWPNIAMHCSVNHPICVNESPAHVRERITWKPMVTGNPDRVPEKVPFTVPRPDAGTYPWRPRVLKKEVSKFAEGAEPVVIARAYGPKNPVRKLSAAMIVRTLSSMTLTMIITTHFVHGHYSCRSRVLAEGSLGCRYL